MARLTNKQLQDKVAELEKEVKRRGKLLDDADTTIIELELHKENLIKSNTGMAKDNARLAERNKCLHNENTRLEHELRQKTTECEIGEDQFRRLRDDHTKIIDSRRKVLIENNELSESIAAKDDIIKALEKDRNEWRNAAADRDNLKYKVGDLQTTVRMLAVQVALESGELVE